MFDKRAMTDKLRRHRILFLAAAALALSACRKPASSAAQNTAPVQKTATLGAVAKPLDAAPAEDLCLYVALPAEGSSSP